MSIQTKAALGEYAKALKNQGWNAGEVVRSKYRTLDPNFDKWCDAVAVFMRAEEIVAGQ